MKTLAAIAPFAVLGAWARYGQFVLVQEVVGHSFPWGTLSINVLGSFAMGFLFFETLDRLIVSPEIRTGILTGFLGAYTTFSTFSLESLQLLQHAEFVKALAYMFGSIFLSVGAAIAGSWLSRNA
ncbi:MAG: fluoride efflux transporter CrcB [Acidiferrobacter sp.]